MKNENHSNLIQRLYGDKNINIRNVTLQITDDCCCKCSYCYQINKGHKYMSKETAKKIIDLLFDMWYKNDNDFINQNTKGIILEFIGGEPLMNIDIIDFVCTYFMNRCIKENHPWLLTWRASMISNGAFYFDEKVQNFLDKFRGYIDFAVTIDGPKEIHDSCRKYHNGKGNFQDAFSAAMDYKKRYNSYIGTKVTICKENIKNLNKIINFFIENDYSYIYANPVFEEKWDKEYALIYYNQLKEMADFLLESNKDIFISLFNENMFVPLPENDNENWCGGTGKMVSFDSNGLAYPCIRYMESSLGNKRKPIVIGDYNGLYNTEETIIFKNELNSITRRSQSDDECFYCPIAKGCAWCSAQNYEQFGTINKRSKNICLMHKARCLANFYYWNKYYKKNNLNKMFYLNLPKEKCLEIINEKEYYNLLSLIKEVNNGNKL